jgi:magnesium transporter
VALSARDHATLHDLIRSARPQAIVRLLGKTHPADIAPLFNDLAPDEIRFLFDVLLSMRRAEKTLRVLPRDLLPDILGVLEDDNVARLVAHAEAEDAVLFLDNLPSERGEKVLALLDPDKRARLENIIRYPRGSVGRSMSTDFVALSPQLTGQEAIDAIRQRGELETFFYVYVVEAGGRLVGVAPLRNLVVAPPERRLADMMIPNPIRAVATMDQEEAARLVSKYDLLALPLVDAEDRLVGIVTIDDVLDIIERQATEDMYKMAGLAGEDRVFTPARRSFRLRLPWMVFNMVTYIPVSLVIGMFEGTIEKSVTLAAFMPIVAGMGGNGITQTMTVIVRALALGELEFSSAWRALRKELAVNVAVAVTTGLLLGVGAYLWKGDTSLGLVLALANIINTGFVAGCFGALIPLTLKALGLDPALGSTIIATTFTDVFGFLSFLGLATLFLRYLS